MPNTLVHFGVQGLLGRALFRGADIKWIFVGCVIPDVPWIVQRMVRDVGPTVDLYDLRLYVIVQASLFGCLFLCGALAWLSDTPSKVFGILFFNAFFHLLLDAVQTKWANGVHLLAPLSWDLLAVGFFWPESPVTYTFTLVGLGYVAWVWYPAMKCPFLTNLPSIPKGVVSLLFLGCYFAVPLFLLNGPQEADNHFVKTLRDRPARVGHPVEFDRVSYIQRSGGDVVRTLAGEEILVFGKSLDHSRVVSIRGRFMNPGTIRIDDLHEHLPWFRDGASILGLALLAILCGLSGGRGARFLNRTGPREGRDRSQ